MTEPVEEHSSLIEPVDTLSFWHPYRDEVIADDWFDWGPVAPRSSADKLFRIKNLSYLYTATGVNVSLFEYGTYTRSVAAQHLLSVNGFTFTASIDVGDLAPRGLTDKLTLRRIVAADADPGEGDIQLIAHPTDWQ